MGESAHSLFSEAAIWRGGIMEERHRQPENKALRLLREKYGWTQKDLARANGIHPNTLSKLEGGKHLPRKKLEELVAPMGAEAVEVAEVLALLDRMDPARRPPASGRPWLDQLVVQTGQALESFVRTAVALCSTAVDALTAHEEAKAQWAILRRHTPKERRTIVRKSREYRNWALAVLLCDESIKEVANEPDRAMELAELALLIAELAPGDEAFRLRLEGYVRFHIGNVKRVQGPPPAADDTMARAKEMWRLGAPGDLTGLLEEARVLGLEASLRKDQRRLPEALALLDRALEIAPAGISAARHQVNKANILKLQGQYEVAVATLHQVAPLIAAVEDDARLTCTHRFALLDCMCHLERFAEAGKLLPELRMLTVSIGKALDQLKLHWLTSRLAAGLGRRQEAISGLAQVRQELEDRGMAYDAALATLELAVLYLEDGRTSEVKILARKLERVFNALGIYPEALAALRLFVAAATREQVSTAWARSLVRYLYLAQGNPALRFEPPA